MQRFTEHTYIFDPEHPVELTRLIDLDRFTTAAMGGPLCGIPPLPQNAKVLDVACGPGIWVLDVAFLRPDIEVAGIDINRSMINYASTRARTQYLSNASFGVMDLRETLDFSENTFDLVNARFLVAALKCEAWTPVLSECKRLLRPGGSLRLIEPLDFGVSNSPAFERMNMLCYQALHQLGYGFAVHPGQLGISHLLTHFQRQMEMQELELRLHALDISHGTVAWSDFYHNAQVVYHFSQKILVQQNLVSASEAEHLYEQLLLEMQRTDFSGMWHWVSVLGKKPVPEPPEVGA